MSDDADLEARIAKVRASSILIAVQELRRNKRTLEQVPDLLGGKIYNRENQLVDTPRRPGWLPPDYTPDSGGLGVCELAIRAAWAKGLLEGGAPGPNGRRRVTLKPDEIVAPIVAQLRAAAEAEENDQ